MTTHPLVECVPNFSTGRNLDTLHVIVKAIQNSAAVYILDVHHDPDHNRSVVTLVGHPDEVENAIVEGIREAARRIDLYQHQGQHPRFGAADVVPFIPLRDMDMAGCVGLAQRVGQRVGDELGIPVYLYGQAATQPERRDLTKLRHRRFQFEQLHEVIEQDPQWLPDYGPARLGSAGATLIGAREILIAFNVFLNTADVSIAEAIARAVRHSNGGLRCVKAMGVLVNGQAQVSLNLSDYRLTPPHRVLEMIRREAQHYGVLVTQSELVGLAPRAAFMESVRWYLQLPPQAANQVLEDRLLIAMHGDSPLRGEEPPLPFDATRQMPLAVLYGQTNQVSTRQDFIAALAEATPTPGGGAVAAMGGILAAALAQMIGTISASKTPASAQELTGIASTAEELRGHLQAKLSEDSLAYQALLEAYRLPKTNPRRAETIQGRLLYAAEIPLHIARLALEVLHLVEGVARLGRPQTVTDSAVAGYMACAAVDSAILTTQVNLKENVDLLTVDRMLGEMQTIQAEAHRLCQVIVQIARHRAGLTE
jgi:glutamate formiminotransferase/formiminotetrahydrofolate cyclodeaminase